MATRYVTDTARANWSSLLSAVVGAGLTVWISFARGDSANFEILPFAVTYYLFWWPLFGVIYLSWTQRAYSAHGPRGLGSRARRETALQQRWWTSILGYGGASSWTLTAAMVAIFVTVAIAQDANYRSDPLYIALGLACVACSWALMVYSFALQYLRLEEGSGEPSVSHIEMRTGDDAKFGDYLTLAILLSTMAATVSASIRTREAWLLVRTNVLFAFAFNSVIVAMVVSLLLGGIVG